MWLAMFVALSRGRSGGAATRHDNDAPQGGGEGDGGREQGGRQVREVRGFVRLTDADLSG